jgi:hypothetical protein
MQLTTGAFRVSGIGRWATNSKSLSLSLSFSLALSLLQKHLDAFSLPLLLLNHDIDIGCRFGERGKEGERERKKGREKGRERGRD